jgi:glycosyltransferase involved in cell wall biosynthesis
MIVRRNQSGVRSFATREVIFPVIEAHRPLWSVMIPTHNISDYLIQAIESVLACGVGPDEMQIEVVDDGSEENPEPIVRAVGGGRVEFYRQTTNVGHTRNFNTCISRARGHLVHILHGDDLVLDGFYRVMAQPFLKNAHVGAAFCRYVAIDEAGVWRNLAPVIQSTSGIIDGWLELIAKAQQLQPPTMVVRRSTYETVGGFDRRIMSYGEDWEMWVRIAAHTAVWHEVRALAAYRVHQNSLSGVAFRTGQNLRDLRTVIELNRELLPAESKERITSLALRNNALGVLRRVRRMIRRGDLTTALVQLRGAVSMSPSPHVLARAVLLTARWVLAKGRRFLRV